MTHGKFSPKKMCKVNVCDARQLVVAFREKTKFPLRGHA